MMQHTSCQHFKKGHRGFSLIEVMVALAISMILLLALATLLMETSNSHRELAKQSRQIENGTYAMLKMGDDVKHAGFYGLYSVIGTPNPAVMPDPCVDIVTATFNSDLSTDLVQATKLPVQGYNNAAPAPINGCINNYQPNTDILVIRRVNTDINNIDVVNTTATRLYLQSSGNGVVIGQGNQYDAGDPNPALFNLVVSTTSPPPLVANAPIAPTFEYFTHIYHVRSCNDCTGTGDGIPTLYRTYLDGTGNFTSEPLVDGIEQLQVEYGLDTSGNGAPDTFVQDPTVAGDTAATITAWRQVVAVQLIILARNTEATNTGAYSDDKTYDLGDPAIYTGGMYTPNDKFKRHLFTSTFKLMNL